MVFCEHRPFCRSRREPDRSSPSPSGLVALRWWAVGWCAVGVGVGVAACAPDERPSPTVIALRPTHVAFARPTQAVIEGRDLRHTAQLSLNDRRPTRVLRTWGVTIDDSPLPAAAVEWQSPESIRIVVPAGLGVGAHALSVTTPTGQRLNLPDGFEVDPLAVVVAAAEDAGAIALSNDAGAAALPGAEDAAVPDAQPDSGPPALPCDPFGFGAPERVTVAGVSGAVFGPAPSSDGLSLFFTTFPANDEDVFHATRTGRGAAFGNAVSLSTLNSINDDGTPFVTADGLSLYFYSTRPGGVGGRDLWRAERAAPDTLSFGAPVPLATLNSFVQDHLPRLSDDELTVWFTSLRGSGNNNLWVAERATRDDPFGAPYELAGLNTSAGESGAALTADELTIVFSSDRRTLGDDDLWVATRPNRASPFGSPAPLDTLNSTAHELDPAITRDGLELFFASERGPTWEIWRSLRQCP